MDRIKAMLEACEAATPPSRRPRCSASMAPPGRHRLVRPTAATATRCHRPGRPMVLRGLAPLGLPPSLSGRPPRRVADPRRRRDRPLPDRRPRLLGPGPAPDARQFVLLEAKLFNRLSSGVKNAPFFDQAARSVACMAEVLRRADREPVQDGRPRLPDPGSPGQDRRRRLRPRHRPRNNPPQGPPPGRAI